MRNDNHTYRESTTDDSMRLKVRVAFALLFLWGGLVGGRLTQLTLFSDVRVSDYAERQTKGSVRIHLPRGGIYDRSGVELAVSVEMSSIYVNPRKVEDAQDTAHRMALILESDKKAAKKRERSIAALISKRKNKSFIWIERKADPNVVEILRAASIPGVGFVKESKRFYPKRDVAAKLIGFCGIDNQGLGGLEYRYNDRIEAKSPRFTVLKDALGRAVSMPNAMQASETARPLDLTLTIDERIQYVAESALSRQVRQTSAKGGVAIVMEPITGEILAIAEFPRFNPNNFQDYSAVNYTSRAVSSPQEPGSTFKIFVVAAALEAQAVTPETMINCENGEYRVGDHTFREANRQRFGEMTVGKIIEKSSNIGAIKVAELIGPHILHAAFLAFGFGERTGVDLPGESPGLLRPVSQWSSTSLPSLSFGQEVAVTPLQLITGVSAIANGGYLIQPRLVSSLSRNSEVVEQIQPVMARRVISERTAREITALMRQVVEEGTGKKGQVPGFAVAGKTGTAQKIDPKTKAYSDEYSVASFVGFLPAENPRLAILVIIDEPKGVSWGGAIAGPVFAEIAERSTRILRIPSSKTDVYEIEWDRMVNREHSQPLTGAGGRG